MTIISKSTQNQLVRLGGRLKGFRKARGLSMAAFARQVDISVAALRRMERGQPGVSMGRWAEVLRRLNGPGDVDGMLAGPGPRAPYVHQSHPRGLRQRPF